MKCKIKYTFLLPAFKAKFFAEALESIKNQTYKDFICIVSDDCSPENLKAIYDEVVGSDSRFTFRRNAENMGSKSLVSHWNMLVDMCETEFLIMASDDDVYEPNFLEEIDKLAEKYPEVDLFRGRVEIIDENSVVSSRDSPYEEYESHVNFLYSLFCCRRCRCIANYVIKTECLIDIGGFFDFPLAWNSDDATIIRISEKGACNTTNIVFSFRISRMNISGSNSPSLFEKKIDANKQCVLFFESYLDKIRCKDSLEEHRYSILKQTLFNDYLANIKTHSVFMNFSNANENYRFLRDRGQIVSIFNKLDYFWLWLRAKLL